MSQPTGRRRAWIALGALGATLVATGFAPATAAPPAPPAPAAPAAIAPAGVDPDVAGADAVDPDPDAVDGEYQDRFLELYAEIKDPANGYFSDQGIPYHAVETLMVEAPDYGHETTSEAYSYWIELEAAYGNVTGEWEPLNEAWATMEQYMIPQAADQPTNSFYNASSPATYASEYNHPSQYPSALNSGVSVGRDPIAAELRAAYGNSDIYGMHWLADVDNVYGFGAAPGAGCTLGPDYEGTSFINTFQRGPQESVWETIPHPSCEEFEYGGPNGYLDLFTGDSSYTRQWKYTNAPDADARAIQAVYWANEWATEQGKQAEIAETVEKAAMMGDYLRYALFDKYFKTIGCTSPSCAAGTGKDSAHYLLSWYYAWGGAVDANSGWAWRIGSSHAHFGYQNPMAAYALSTVPALQPEGATAVQDWETSFDRQLEFYRWLQSADGAIAGGATNSWNGAYATPPAGTPTFYGMGYVEAPVYNDPSSNQWFGMQVWGMERVAELYYETGDTRAEEILEQWIPWAMANTTFEGANWRVPSTLTWSGAPDTWNPQNPGANANLHVTVKDHGQDVGVAGSLARTLIYWAAAADDEVAQENARSLLDAIWESNRDEEGVSAPEVREDYRRFDDVMSGSTGDGTYVPAGWSGEMPNGDVIEPGASFLDIRSFYRDDPDWPRVQAYLDGGAAPEFRYHRFWAQAEIAKALADYDRMFGGGGDPEDPDTQAPTAPGTPTASAITATSATLTWTASTDDVGVPGYIVQSASGATLATSSSTSATLSGLTADTAYTVRVVARDAAGNVSTPSTAVTFRTQAGSAEDTEAPTAPGTPAVSAITTGGATVSWAASTDNVGVVSYEVLSATGTRLATSTTTSVTLGTLVPNRAYAVRVVARDAAGNVSTPSATVAFQTLPDTPTGACTATLSVGSSWQGGYQANVTVKAGTAAINGWTTSFALSGSIVSNLWSGTQSGTSSAVTVRNTPWNGSLGAGATTSYGFIGSGTAPASTVAVTCATS